jgi:hypothetical protein
MSHADGARFEIGIGGGKRKGERRF